MDTPLPLLEPLTIDVFSDVVCPWCYLGKRQLEHALTLSSGASTVVRWRPFLLDATIPPEGMSRTDYLMQKFGSLVGVASIHERLIEYGGDEGIDYRFDKITRSPNTVDAHRLIRWASSGGLRSNMVERLFRAYFTEGADIGDQAVLARLAGEVGLSAAEIAMRLASNADRALVAAEIEDAYRIGVTGVPCFILDQRYAIMGAQPAVALAGAIARILEKRATA